MTYINKQQILEKAKEYQCSPFGIPLIIAEIEKTDGVEVKHGRYIADTNYRTLGNCSECGGDLTFLNNYCPNCGAKMDGGKTDVSM